MGVASGFPVVLTADRTLMAGYATLFGGILAATQTTTAPPALLGPFLLPNTGGKRLAAEVAPLGLRRIEAALLRDGFARDEVLVVHPARLREAIGPATRVVGISTADPLGLGMNSTTMTAIAGGRAYPAAMFARLMRSVRRASAGARVVVGGAGAWQLVARPDDRRRHGIDHVLTGYAEGNVAAVFRQLVGGDSMPPVIAGESPPAAAVPPVRAAATMGVVEISRGCGLGCRFCTIAATPMLHLPVETVVADAETSVAAGVPNVCIISEDIFRYGADGRRRDPAALLALLRRLREIDGLGLVQADHGNIATVMQYRDDDLAELRRLMIGPTSAKLPWINLGVETASGRLLRAGGGAAKMPCPEDDWAHLCREQLLRLSRLGFLPLASLVVGLPGETDDDTRRTLDWVESFERERLAIFPLLYAPVDGSRPVGARDLTPLQWRLIRRCYRLNFRWIPRLLWDNQRAAGVSIKRRCIIRIIVGAEASAWRGLLARGRFRKRREPENGN